MNCTGEKIWRKFYVDFVLTASAESYLNECLAIYQTVYGPNDAKTLEVQDELARLMVRTDRPEVSLMSIYVVSSWNWP